MILSEFYLRSCAVSEGLEFSVESVVKAILLGLVQGLTEFLPVSSSGHLVFAKDLLGVPEPGIQWAICLHAATAAATIAVFWREILDLLRGFGRGVMYALQVGSVSEAAAREPKFKLALLYLVAIIPVGLAGFFLKGTLDKMFDDALLAGAALGITGTVLWLTRTRPDPESGQTVSLSRAIIMGVAQAVALIPGISRSGATISSGILSGVKAGEAARFSFLMAVPPILGAALLKAKDIRHTAMQSSTEFVSLAAGFIVAAVVGYFALRWLLGIVQRGKLYRFAYYCWALGAAVLIWKGLQLLTTS